MGQSQPKLPLNVGWPSRLQVLLRGIWSAIDWRMDAPIATPVACPSCKAASRKFGTNRNGSQRFQCLTCKKTFSAPTALGHMRLPLDVAVLALQLIIEGNSLRSTTRIARVNLRTAIDLLVLVGERCEAMLEGRIQGLPVVDVQCDEIWSFVGMKENRHGEGAPQRFARYGQVCTSHVERQNLTIRMGNRRLTRLTNGFSKKWANHAAAFALQFAYCNFCRIHETLTDATKVEGKAKVKTTPAMAAGLADHPWTLEELVWNTMPAPGDNLLVPAQTVG